MRKSLRKIVPTLLFMIMCLTILTPAAMAAENPNLEISATVSLSGALPDTPEDFSIKLTADEMSNPMPEGSLNGVATVIINGGGTVTFPKITFSKVGMYDYTIWQEPGMYPDATYDEEIYHLTVFVTNAAGGGLEITTVVYKEGEEEKSPSIDFDNKYPNPAFIKFQAAKTLDGKTPLDERFKFYLTSEDGELLQTKTNMGMSVEFDEIKFNEVGTHIFYIREEKGNDILIIYDETVFKVTVTVTKDPDGNYVASAQYEQSDNPVAGIPAFTNKTKLPDLPDAGESQSALPFVGVVLVIGGLALTMRRKTVKQFSKYVD